MKKTLGCIAVSALFAACASSGPEDAKSGAGLENAASSEQGEVVRCFGINSCAAYAKCAVTAEDVEATKKVFGDKFAATELHECSGLAKCAAEGGQLNWVQVSKKECGEKEGFLITNAPDGGKVVTEI